MKHSKIEKLLNDYNKSKQFETSKESFIESCKRYIAATKSTRMMCSIDTVSRSGMSRTMKFFELQRNNHGGYSVLNFYQLFDILGYQKVSNSDYFRIHGCGMDMVFATHYNVIHELHGLGFITRKTCDELAQITPHKV